MAWFKVDDKMHSSKKLLSIPRSHRLAALGLWTISGSWSADQLTDGHVPDYMIDEWGGAEALVSWLVRSGLWHEVDEGTQFHNWDEYNPTKADVEADREKNREKLRKWRERNRGSNEDVTGLQGGSKPVSNPAPDPTRPDPSPVSAGRRKPERPLPPEWLPTEAHRAYANDNGISLDFQADRFRNHAQANDRRARDWDAAFRNWLLKAEKSTTSKNPLWDD